VKTKTFGERLAHAIQESGISQAELARQVGISQQAIQRMCKNGAERSSYVAEIAECLNICPFWLATGVGLTKPWGSLGGDARLVASKYEELPIHGQRQLQEYLEYLRKRFPPEAGNSLSVVDDC